MPDLKQLKQLKPKSKFKKFLSALGSLFKACGQRKKTPVKNMSPENKQPGVPI
jgi:hypothetical protein